MPEPRVQAGRQGLGQADHEVDGAERAEAAAELRATSRRRCSGSRTPLAMNSRKFGRSSVPRSMSRNGVGTCWLTTRIISSGVMPLAASAATNEPALVPT